MRGGVAACAAVGLGAQTLAAPPAVAAIAEITPIPPSEVVLGVDLSYVNEMEDCGATYRHESLDDPFAILAASGANLVRARLWHDPDWTAYSTIDDVIRTFQRARDNGMRTLLDFHYSDEWADPARQNPPAAWAAIDDVADLADELGAYTADTLERLDAAGVLPDIVQVGNEINSGLVNGAVGLDWDHDLPLLEAGIDAVRSVSATTGRHIDVMLHVAQPENALWWFEDAAAVGLDDFDIIGLSYYAQWSRFTPEELGSAVQVLASSYGKDVMVVEAAYPWTLDGAGDSADNVLDQGLRSHRISPAGQAELMADLTQIVVANGGLGTVYWEPAWLSTDCGTRWGQGSHWENATLFDFDGQLHAGAGYLAAEYDPLLVADVQLVTVTDPRGDAEPGADLVEVAGRHDGRLAMVTATIAGDVRDWPGAVLLAVDNTSGDGGDGGRRPYDFVPEERPELVLETSWSNDPGAGFASTTLHRWSGAEWEPETFTGRVVIDEPLDGVTTVTWMLPGGAVEPAAGVTVVTARRGRAGALADVVDPAALDAVPMAIQLGGHTGLPDT